MVVITQQEAAERLSPAFEGRKGKWLFRLAAGMTGIAKVNALHDRVDTAGVPYGPAFAKALLDDVGVDFRVGNPEWLDSLPEGPFIVIANHIYGHLDGICLLDLFGRQRPETKVMVNEMLTWIPGLAPSFIAVNPVTAASKGVSDTSINGVKNALLQLQEGGSLCLFPSGAVADLKPREHWTLSHSCPVLRPELPLLLRARPHRLPGALCPAVPRAVQQARDLPARGHRSPGLRRRTRTIS